MKYIVLILTLVGLVFGVTAELHEQYQIGPDSELELYNVNGDVVITGIEGNKLIIDIVKKTKKDQAELDKVTVDIISGKTFKVKTRHLEDNVDVSVDISLQVPAHIMEAFIENVNGTIDVEGISAAVNVENANGDITLVETHGPIDIELANGDVKIEGDVVIEDIKLANGSITAEVRALSEDGAQLEVANGEIKVYILQSLNADIQANIVMGDIDVHDLHIDSSNHKKNFLEGKINDGGPLIEISVAIGSIKIYCLKD